MMPSASTSARISSGSLPIPSSFRRKTAICSNPNRTLQLRGHYRWYSWTGDTAQDLANRVSGPGRRAVRADVVGYASNRNWLTAIDPSWLDVGHRFSVAHPGRVTAWNLFCTVLGPTAFRSVAP